MNEKSSILQKNKSISRINKKARNIPPGRGKVSLKSRYTYFATPEHNL